MPRLQWDPVEGTTVEISAILSNIKYNNYSLPEFQRGYVWRREDVRSLFDSLYRRYPVGGFLVWTTQPDPQMVRGASNPGAAVKLLLDGQQRATSLYGVIRGEVPAFFRGDKNAFEGLYFNVKSETFEFYGPVKMRDDPLWVSVTEVFETDDVNKIVNKIVESMSSQEHDMKVMLEYGSRLNKLRNIQNVSLHIEEISGEDRTIDEVVDMFNRVNSGGTKLSSADLALARLCAHSPDVRNELLRHLGEWGKAGYRFRQEWLLRCATAVATNRASFNSLRGVNPDDFSVALKKAVESIDFLLNLLKSRLGIDHHRVVSGPYALVALARLVSDRGGSISDVPEQCRMLYWYVSCFIWGRHSGSTETRMQSDLDALDKDGIGGLIDELVKWRGGLEVRPGDFDGSTIGARFYPLLYILTRVFDAHDLDNGLSLSHGMFGYKSQLHVHHIFPKKRLYAEGYSLGQVNGSGQLLLAHRGVQLAHRLRRSGGVFCAGREEHPRRARIPVDPRRPRSVVHRPLHGVFGRAPGAIGCRRERSTQQTERWHLARAQAAVRRGFPPAAPSH
ncbi:MAG: DUF262 domain-containing protein [Acidimicrobiaceae bacterium]|nr:DUF262 domain-containing protein [Acidimicrobiaceae bacterium]